VHLASRKKLNFWGAVASIIGVPLAVFLWVFPPTTASSQSQPRSSVSTTGAQSPAIGSSGRDVIINYNAPVKGMGHELKRSTPLVDSPNPANLVGPEASKHIVCTVLAGTPVTPTGKTAKISGLDMWHEVEVNAGDCQGKRGWVEFTSLDMK
jgi:hypothetical protein